MSERQIGEKSSWGFFYNDEEYWFNCKMKIVVAMDSFKESLSAEAACDIVAEAIVSVRPEAEVVVKPMADGGEGTAQALIRACGGAWIAATVMGPLPEMQVEAGFAWFDADKTALVEMATASGLELLGLQQRNPLQTTTYGTGQLIAAAIEYGARKVYLAVGGSATVDGAVGAAAALGWTFLDSGGKELSLGGGELGRLKKIIPPRHAPGIPVEVLCDVDNPLCGSRGAARVYGPQKGAAPEMVEQLEAGLLNLAAVVREQLACRIQDIPGAGAAGGLAAGAVAFMDARLISGIEFVIAQSGLEQAAADADWVITGEGRFDHQSLAGKVISGISAIAARTNAKVCVLAGQVALEPPDFQKHGINCAMACMSEAITLQHALKHADKLLAKTAGEFAARYL